MLLSIQFKMYLHVSFHCSVQYDCISERRMIRVFKMITVRLLISAIKIHFCTYYLNIQDAYARFLPTINAKVISNISFVKSDLLE